MKSGGDTGATPRQRLLRFAAGIGERFGHERSCKFSEGRISPERHLVSFARRALHVECEALLALLAARFRWPESSNDAVRSLWPAASHLHLGLEVDSTRTVWKIYLESASACLEPLVPPDPGWGAIHRAFKWSVATQTVDVAAEVDLRPGAAAPTRTDYDGLLLPGDAVRRRLTERVLGRSSTLLAAMRALIARAGGPRAMLLRVTDRGTDRVSIDLNLYPMAWRVRDLRDDLIRFAVAVGTDACAAGDWIDSVAGQPLGHLAAGFDASGMPFTTIYHGIHDCDGGCLQ